MRFFGTTVTKFAVVETDAGEFQVFEKGEMHKWNDEHGQWAWFDKDKFDEKDLVVVYSQGLAALRSL